jgi:hypothetical protein
MGIEPTYEILARTLDLKSRRPTRRLGTSTYYSSIKHAYLQTDSN